MSTGSKPARLKDSGIGGTSMVRVCVTVAFATQALLLAACGNSNTTVASMIGGSSSVSTSSVPQPTPNDPSSRALQVSATSARASYCNFNFDPAKLKAKYLAFESAQGATPDQMNKIERAYDYGRTSISQTISNQPDYCSEHQGRVIKADLARHLAGDYTPAPEPAEPQGGGFLSGLMDGGSNKKPYTGTFNDQTGQIE